MKYVTLACLLLLSSDLALADTKVYENRDTQGVPTFSNVPQQNANEKTINIPDQPATTNPVVQTETRELMNQNRAIDQNLAAQQNIQQLQQQQVVASQPNQTETVDDDAPNYYGYGYDDLDYLQAERDRADAQLLNDRRNAVHESNEMMNMGPTNTNARMQRGGGRTR